jgi:hypothetical protein
MLAPLVPPRPLVPELPPVLAPDEPPLELPPPPRSLKPSSSSSPHPDTARNVTVKRALSAENLRNTSSLLATVPAYLRRGGDATGPRVCDFVNSVRDRSSDISPRFGGSAATALRSHARTSRSAVANPE